MADIRSDLEQKAVLVVAPSRMVEIVQIVVRQAGGRRVVTGYGKALDDILRRETVGLVLVDEASTEPEPFALAARLETLTAGLHLPMLILMASAPTRRLVNQALAAGIGAVIAKPFSARALMDCVAGAHAAREARRANMVNQVFLD